MAPQWLYLDIWAHINAEPPVGLKLYWYDDSWKGFCNVGNGVEVYNICSVPYGVKAIALSLIQGDREVDRIEIWGIGPANVSCVVTPSLRVINRTSSIEPPMAVVSLKSTMMNNIAVYFQAYNYSVERVISIRNLNPCDDYVIRLYYYGVYPPWRITAVGNYTPAITVTKTETTTSTITVSVPVTTTYTYTVVQTVTEREVVTATITTTRAYTETVFIREIDFRSIILAFLGVAMFAMSLILFMLAGKRR